VIIIYLAVAGACAEDEANAGGGGTSPAQIPFTIAVDASSGANNAMTGGMHHFNAPNGVHSGLYIDFADGTSGTSAGQSTYGTASSPTRTTQTAHVRVSEVQAAFNLSATAGMSFLFGGYVRVGNMGSLSNIHWQTPNQTPTSSLSNGNSMTSHQVTDNREHNQNNTLVDGFSKNNVTNTNVPQGIYEDFNSFFGINTQFYLYSVQFGGGRGGILFPAVNDTITFRIQVDGDVGGTTHTVIHDFIIKYI